ncbi:hypothetical protein R50072_07940 [Simiduia litorea]
MEQRGVWGDITAPYGHSHFHAWSPRRSGWVTFVRTKVTKKTHEYSISIRGTAICRISMSLDRSDASGTPVFAAPKWDALTGLARSLGRYYRTLRSLAYSCVVSAALRLVTFVRTKSDKKYFYVIHNEPLHRPGFKKCFANRKGFAT